MHELPKNIMENTLRAIRGGHIPSAINIDWKENISIDKFKSLE